MDVLDYAIMRQIRWILQVPGSVLCSIFSLHFHTVMGIFCVEGGRGMV